jgi:hypothetical protein
VGFGWLGVQSWESKLTGAILEDWADRCVGPAPREMGTIGFADGDGAGAGCGGGGKVGRGCGCDGAGDDRADGIVDGEGDVAVQVLRDGEVGAVGECTGLAGSGWSEA